MKWIKKNLLWASAIFSMSLCVVLGIVFIISAFIASIGATQCASGIGGDGHAYGGDWQNVDSQTHQSMQYTADRLKNELHFSGDNVAAVLAIGLRESGFNPNAVNPKGEVKGIFQWGYGTTNGNRYGETQDNVEAQINLTINELRSNRKVTLVDMAQANNIESSLIAWDTNFEGLKVNDPQRKAADILATANEVKKVFQLDYAGNIDTSQNNSSASSDLSDSSTSASAGAGACLGGLATNDNGLPIKGKYNITGGYPNYNGADGAPHYGVDFQTVDHDETGAASNVYAVASGTVIKVGNSKEGGYFLVIKGDDGVYTYYGHAPSKEAIVVNTGDKVQKGQHISHEGQSGEATGIHVHFGVNTKSDQGFGIQADGNRSPGQYLKLPKAAGESIVIPSGPFDSQEKD
ncbi:Murein DD-endopeptidase MepM and murein hydrolase activator NlpD [Fructobacillus tropaeoli]|nr:Murein DD-endopeptidase MepM and murein hydrolase activator NlpD [Fructobacillus tropaeoli]